MYALQHLEGELRKKTHMNRQNKTKQKKSAEKDTKYLDENA